MSLSAIPGSASPFGPIEDGTVSSYGDPHISVKGTDPLGKSVDVAFRDTSDRADLITSTSLTGGYTVSSTVTALKSGVAYNKDAKLTTLDGGAVFDVTKSEATLDGADTGLAVGDTLTLLGDPNAQADLKRAKLLEADAAKRLSAAKKQEKDALIDGRLAAAALARAAQEKHAASVDAKRVADDNAHVKVLLAAANRSIKEAAFFEKEAERSTGGRSKAFELDAKRELAVAAKDEALARRVQSDAKIALRGEKLATVNAARDTKLASAARAEGKIDLRDAHQQSAIGHRDAIVAQALVKKADADRETITRTAIDAYQVFAGDANGENITTTLKQTKHGVDVTARAAGGAQLDGFAVRSAETRVPHTGPVIP